MLTAPYTKPRRGFLEHVAAPLNARGTKISLLASVRTDVYYGLGRIRLTVFLLSIIPREGIPESARYSRSMYEGVQ